MRRTLLVVMIDALRHDFVNESMTPWLNGLVRSGASRSVVEETFGFIGVRSSVFYGLYPKDSDYVFLYNLAARGDLWFLNLLPNRLIESRRTRKRIVRRYNKIRRHFDAEYVKSWDLSRVPARILRHVRVSEKKVPWSRHYLPGRQSLFDRVEHFLYLGYPDSGGATGWLRKEAIRQYDGQGFVWIHFSDVDHAEHSDGPSSSKVRDALREVDSAVREIYEHLVAQAAVDLVVFGDHGCIDVDGCYDVLGWLPEDLERRSLYFLDSTMARFWCRNPSDAREIRELLAKRTDAGRIVDPEVLETQYHCRYRREIFGDVLFVVRAGGLVCPNFFQSEPGDVKGMHGYLPEVEDNCAALLVHSDRRLEVPARMKMPEVHPILCSLLDGRAESKREGS